MQSVFMFLIYLIQMVCPIIEMIVNTLIVYKLSLQNI